MRWSFKIATVAGTTLFVHITFFLLLAWVAAVGWKQGGAPGALDGVLFICLVFLCVVLHEFGHVFAARRYGIRTPDITLLPIGGVANLERMPERPVHELVVAIAGPLVNVVIAALLIVFLGARFDITEMVELQAAQMSMAGRIAAVNIILIVFNLIPAFPLDGGRMLRALLAMRFDRARATLYAARTGQAFAILFALIGLMGNPFLLLIAVFIFLAAEAESGHEQMRAAATGFRARDAMITRYESLHPHSTAEDASRLLLLTTQQEFPVLGPGGVFLGMVTRQGLVKAIRESGNATPVTEFMVTELLTVAEDDDLEQVMAKVAKSPTRSVAVQSPGRRFLGYVSAENAAELFMVSAARSRQAAR